MESAACNPSHATADGFADRVGRAISGYDARFDESFDAVTDDLIAYPILTVSDAQRRYGRSNQANRNAIGSLLELGILDPYSDARYDRLYWNRRVFQIIDS